MAYARKQQCPLVNLASNSIAHLNERFRGQAHFAGAGRFEVNRLPALTEAFRNAVKRCISNLVDNATEFGNRVAIIASRKNGYVEIAIDDDGPGIPTEQIEYAFKPFNRLDESRNLDKGGVGLGLAIAQDVARGHGGELTLLRSPWGGLRALVRLPV